MPKLTLTDPKPTPDEQLWRWVEGDPVCPNTRDECCPDFSCCKPELLQPEDVRRAFAMAGESERLKFLGNFLGAAFAATAPGKAVRVIGTGSGDPE